MIAIRRDETLKTVVASGCVMDKDVICSELRGWMDGMPFSVIGVLVEKDDDRATEARDKFWIWLSPIPVALALLKEDSERMGTSLPAMPPLAPPSTRELAEDGCGRMVRKIVGYISGLDAPVETTINGYHIVWTGGCGGLMIDGRHVVLIAGQNLGKGSGWGSGRSRVIMSDSGDNAMGGTRMRHHFSIGYHGIVRRGGRRSCWRSLRGSGAAIAPDGLGW
jgi:hypothetical protein